MDEEVILCEKCGAEMNPIHQGFTVGAECPNCGWGYVTSYIPPMYSDTRTYSVILDSNQYSVERVKLIASIANCNFIHAKKLIESAPVSIFSGRAVEVKAIKEKLEEAHIACSIEPEFPY